MPRNGSGVYSLPSAYDVAVGDTIQPEDTETAFEDIETDLNAARPVVAGGTGATTAAAARTNLGVQGAIRANDTTGSSNAYAVSTEETLSSLTDGDPVLIVGNHSNTGAATLDVDSLGAKDIQKDTLSGPVALVANDIISGNHYLVTYDASVGTGTWILHNPSNPEDDTSKVDVAGDTMTGDLILDKTTALLGLGRSGDTGPHGITFAGDNLPADKEMAIFYRTSAGGTMAIEDSAANILLAVARSGTISLNNAVTGTALATQAEAETGTNSDQLMTPLRAHQAAKAANPVKIAVKLTTLTGTPTITTTYNQQGTLSAVRNSLGNYTLSWTTALSAVHGQLTPQRSGAAYSVVTGLTTTSLTVEVRDGGANLLDPDALFVTVMGA